MGDDHGMFANRVWTKQTHKQRNCLIDVDINNRLTPMQTENCRGRGSIFYTIMNVFNIMML